MSKGSGKFNEGLKSCDQSMVKFSGLKDIPTGHERTKKKPKLVMHKAQLNLQGVLVS